MLKKNQVRHLNLKEQQQPHCCNFDVSQKRGKILMLMLSLKKKRKRQNKTKTHLKYIKQKENKNWQPLEHGASGTKGERERPVCSCLFRSHEKTHTRTPNAFSIFQTFT